MTPTPLRRRLAAARRARERVRDDATSDAARRTSVRRQPAGVNRAVEALRQARDRTVS